MKSIVMYLQISEKSPFFAKFVDSTQPYSFRIIGVSKNDILYEKIIGRFLALKDITSVINLDTVSIYSTISA